MKRNLLNLFFVFCVINGITQNPGYMGSKWVVYGSTALSPALNKRYLELDQEGNSTAPNIGVNVRFDISTDFTLSKIVAIGGSVKHITTKIPYAYYSVDLNTDLSNFDEASYFGDVTLNANFASFYLKFYPFGRRGVIAPVGNYNKFELMVGMIGGSTGGWSSDTYDPTISRYYEYGESLILPTFEDLNYQLDEKVFGLLYTFGNSWAFTEKLLFDFSTQFGWVIGSSDISSDGNYGEGETTYEQHAIDRVQGTFLMNFNFGIGYFIL
ncbi:MAG: hypothetical protein IPH42_18330 [Bacteroidetes bacterium]|nr:hypothetical protein [Bacteroidota bacterium]